MKGDKTMADNGSNQKLQAIKLAMEQIEKQYGKGRQQILFKSIP
jgi:hypothetical protein